MERVQQGDDGSPVAPAALPCSLMFYTHCTENILLLYQVRSTEATGAGLHGLPREAGRVFIPMGVDQR